MVPIKPINILDTDHPTPCLSLFSLIFLIPIISKSNASGAKTSQREIKELADMAKYIEKNLPSYNIKLCE